MSARTWRYGIGTIVRKGTVMVVLMGMPVSGFMEAYMKDTVMHVWFSSKPTVLMKLMVVIAEAACALTAAISGPAPQRQHT